MFQKGIKAIRCHCNFCHTMLEINPNNHKNFAWHYGPDKLPMSEVKTDLDGNYIQEFAFHCPICVGDNERAENDEDVTAIY